MKKIRGINKIKKNFREMGDFGAEKKELEQQHDRAVRDFNNKINRKQKAINRRADKIAKEWEKITQGGKIKITINGIKERTRQWAVVVENLEKVINSFRRCGLNKLIRTKTEIVRTPKKALIRKMILEGSRDLAGIKRLKLSKQKELVITLITGEKILRTLSTFEKFPPSR